jgi:hypothetical protein
MDKRRAHADSLSCGSPQSAERRHNMSAVILKRKLRNFPTGNLTIRVVGS